MRIFKIISSWLGFDELRRRHAKSDAARAALDDLHAYAHRARARSFPDAWADLRQRVVEELRRELYNLPTPWHLRILENSLLVNDECIYDRAFDRWESDVRWCAELFGEDPDEFLKEVRASYRPDDRPEVEKS